MSAIHQSEKAPADATSGLGRFGGWVGRCEMVGANVVGSPDGIAVGA